MALRAAVVAIFKESGVFAHIGVETEGLLGEGSGERPGDVVGLLFSDTTQTLAVDVTVLHIHASSYVRSASQHPGKDLAAQEGNKRALYADNCKAHGIQFAPFAVDEFGHIGDAGQALLQQLALRSAVRRSTDFTEGSSVPERVAYRLRAWRARIAWAVHEGMYHSVSSRLAVSRGHADDPPPGTV